jgi:hypothetical protein
LPAEDGADVRLRIIVAIGTLGEPPTESRHELFSIWGPRLAIKRAQSRRRAG